MLLIGTDEAGYGPNLGPLTVAGTMWRVPSATTRLYHCLRPLVTANKPDENQIQIADSKQVYQSSGSISRLETAVLAAINLINGRTPSNVQALCELVCPGLMWSQARLQAGFEFDELKLPIAACPQQIATLASSLKQTLEDSEIQLLSLECEPVFPDRFNQQLSDLGNKAHVLSGTTFSLIRRLMESVQSSESQPLQVVCDKHGGRSKYAALLTHWLTNAILDIECESAQKSVYHFEDKFFQATVEFKVGGESFLPTALASMVAKYLREIFMVAWNRFWKVHLPEIKPTKGYPVDAKRFKQQISGVQQQLKINDDAIWRRR